MAEKSDYLRVQASAQIAQATLATKLQPQLELIGNSIAANDKYVSAVHRAALNTLDTLSSLVQSLAEMEDPTE